MSPFQSEAQRRKFAELVKQGKMKQSVFDEWNAETPKNIPERAPSPNKKSQKVRTVDQVGVVRKIKRA